MKPFVHAWILETLLFSCAGGTAVFQYRVPVSTEKKSSEAFL